MQKWFREAENDDVRAELLVHLNRSDNWFDLYKSMELARRLFADRDGLEHALSDHWTEWKRVSQTANCYRHAPDPKRNALPARPVTFEEAREFVLSAVRDHVLDANGARHSPT